MQGGASFKRKAVNIAICSLVAWESDSYCVAVVFRLDTVEQLARELLRDQLRARELLQ